VLEAALCFYDDIRSYRQDSQDNEYPTLAELIKDGGLRARVGRLSCDLAEFDDWMSWLWKRRQAGLEPGKISAPVQPVSETVRPPERSDGTKLCHYPAEPCVCANGIGCIHVPVEQW
jgi:hypothetical protein